MITEDLYLDLPTEPAGFLDFIDAIRQLRMEAKMEERLGWTRIATPPSHPTR